VLSGGVPRSARSDSRWRRLLMALRWPGRVAGLHCSRRQVDDQARYARCRDLPRYRRNAKACRRTFLLTTGTPLAAALLHAEGNRVWIVNMTPVRMFRR